MIEPIVKGNASAKYYKARKYNKNDIPLLELISELFRELNEGHEQAEGRIDASAYTKNCWRVEKIIDFLKLPYKLSIKDYRQGIININNKVYYSLLNDKWIKVQYVNAGLKWKNKTKKVSIDEFVKKYVLEVETQGD